MKKLLIGAILGAGIGYLARKMQEEGFLEQLSDGIDDFACKAKKKFKNALDKSKNEVNYIKERTQDSLQKGAEKLDNLNK